MNKIVKFLFGKPPAPLTLEQTAMQPNCSNCGAELSGPFCSICGQKKEHKHDLTVWHFLGHSLHEFTHLDSRFLRSFKYLITKPGFLTEEYIAGHRKKYINPIRLFILINIIYFILISFTGSNTFTTPLQVQVNDMFRNIVRPMVLSEIHKKGISYREYEEIFDHNMKTQAKSLIIIMVPMFAFILGILYFRQKRYYVEHLTFSLYFFSILLLVLTIGLNLFFLTLKIFFEISFKFSKPLAVFFQNIIYVSNSEEITSILILITIFIILIIALKRVYN